MRNLSVLPELQGIKRKRLRKTTSGGSDLTSGSGQLGASEGGRERGWQF